MRIRFITTGGTIDKIYFDETSTFEVGEPQIGKLLEEAHINFEYEITSILRKDSLQLTEEDRNLIVTTVEQATEQKIIVTHGTDTMVKTAKALEKVKDKTVVLVGSMQPARFKITDAVFNIGYAVAAVQQLNPGIYIAMNGQIFHPDKVQKNTTLKRFEEIA